MNTAARSLVSISAPARITKWAGWIAIFATTAALLLLASLHALSPEFAPSWRMISEYAMGRHAWVLSLMFLTMGAGTCASAVALWPQLHTRAAKAGAWLLIVSGCGGLMASVFDVAHPIGHAIAGLLGVIAFPVAALLLSVALGRNKAWRGARIPLLWMANLSWISVILLVATLAIMTIQMMRIYAGHLPQHAPPSLPPGVLAVDGWADRLIVLTNSAWVLFAADRALRLCRQAEL